MTSFDQLLPEDQAALEAAALWSEKLRAEPAQELSAEFLRWISDPRNAKALNAVRDAMANLDAFGATPAILDMRRSALTRLRNAGARRWPSRRILARIAAAALLCTTGAGGYLWYRAHSPVTYETGIGERQLVPLPDGSRISLDSDSRVEVRYTNALRTIKLDHGRARFDVAHDTSRPFTVAAGVETVVAVGTAFNVEKLGSKVLVTLIQGRVVIKSESGALQEIARERPAIRLAAGQQMAVVDDSVPVVQQANLDVATAWESGHLVFRGETLGDAVRQVNRYTNNPITVTPSAASIPISGVFNAGDVGSFVSAITGYFPVDATTDSENRIRLQKRT
jgi:transmembrane sensor